MLYNVVLVSAIQYVNHYIYIYLYIYLSIYIYIYIPSLLYLPATAPLHPILLGHHRVPGCARQQLPTSHLVYTCWYIHVNATLSLHPTLLFSPRCPVYTSVLFVCVSILALQKKHKSFFLFFGPNYILFLYA